jgi:hypothetical protein
VSSSSHDAGKLVLAGAIVLASAAGLYAYVNRTPQLGWDEEVHVTVDALFTAMTSRSEKRLAECETRLEEFHRAGRLPDAAAEQIRNFIDEARTGSWRPAAEELYDFVLAQKNDYDHP